MSLLGASERNLKLIREALGVNIAARDDVVRVSGESQAVHAAREVLDRLTEKARRRKNLSRADVLRIIADAGDRPSMESLAGSTNPSPGERALGALWGDRLDVYVNGKPVAARSGNQQAYLDSIRDYDLVFAVGPAGTGKTYLAVAAAVHLLKIGKLRKVVLARPAVEAGEKLGFLPGDMEAKINPYLRPLFDALNDMMDYDTIRRFITSDVIEVAPLAFLRGRTLNDAIIILDEAQNTTRGQMKMFLTRMGQRSKMIVTGDTTQIDLPDPRESGLIDAARRLRRVPGIGFVSLSRADIVRHNLVQRIVDAYGDEQTKQHADLDFMRDDKGPDEAHA